MADRLLIRISSEPLDAAEALRFVADGGAGGTVLFTGTVRDHSERGDVDGLDYEAWEELARARLRAIGEEMLAKWPLVKAVLLHRTGSLSVGETSVVVCCSAEHRGDAFEAAHHGIDRLKEDAPIWKRERLTSGEAEWVMGS